VLADDDLFKQTKFSKVRRRLSRIADRLQNTLGPPQEALAQLDVANAPNVEMAAAQAYPHVQRLRTLLRDGLANNAVRSERADEP
jgi:hypothetical protein